MARVTWFQPVVFNQVSIPPRETLYFWLGPFPGMGNATFTVTPHGLLGLVTGPQYLEIVQLATRTGANDNDRFLDCVIRNNSPTRCPWFAAQVSTVQP
jgi:hypothetical protein